VDKKTAGEGKKQQWNNLQQTYEEKECTREEKGVNTKKIQR
jgi:hypothetical protein